MAVPAGWSAADWAAYKDSIPHAARWASRLTILDLNHTHLETVPDAGFLEGQWNLIGDGDVDRTFQGGFFDVGGTLAPHFDPAAAPARLLQVRQGTYVGSLSKWLWVTTFTGRPHLTVDSGSGSWRVEAQGKDCFHNRGVPTGVFRKGAYVVDAIRNYLTSTGETYMSIPSSATITKRLAADVKFGGAADQMTPLAAMRRIASLAGCQLYWTGPGVATMRPWPTSNQPVFTWDARTVLSVPTYSTDMSSLKNRWTGGGRYTLRADVSATGPYAPTSLSRGGVPWSDIDFGEDNESLTSAAALAAFGQNRVESLVTLSTIVSCDVVPFHAVDQLDFGVVVTPDRSEKCVIRDASVPIAGSWTTGEAPAMSLGSHHNTQRGQAGKSRNSGLSRRAAVKHKRKRRRR